VVAEVVRAIMVPESARLREALERNYVARAGAESRPQALLPAEIDAQDHARSRFVKRLSYRLGNLDVHVHQKQLTSLLLVEKSEQP